MRGEEIARLVGHLSNLVILDIGCNDGEHTQMFLDVFKSAQVFCFEPDPRAQKRFLQRVADERVQLFRTALGSTDGVAQFHQSHGWPSSDHARYMPDGWDLSGSLLNPLHHLSVHPWCTFDAQITVPVCRLDTWSATHIPHKRIDFIWADVQGAEGELIAGGLRTLGRTRFFYTEYSNQMLYAGQPSLDQLCAMLPNFELIAIDANDVLFRNIQCEN